VIPAGSTSATVLVTTTSVSSDATVTFTAVYRGSTLTATLIVTPPSVALNNISVLPLNVVGGLMNNTGTLTLTAPANAGGALVTLSSSNPADQHGPDIHRQIQSDCEPAFIYSLTPRMIPSRDMIR
jgi:hypothetical protein